MHILSQASLPSVHPQQSSVPIFPRLKSGCYFLNGDSQELFNVNPLSFAFWRYCPSNLSFFKKLVFSVEHWVTLLKTYLSNCLPWISCFGSFLIWEDYAKKTHQKKKKTGSPRFSKFYPNTSKNLNTSWVLWLNVIFCLLILTNSKLSSMIFLLILLDFR